MIILSKALADQSFQREQRLRSPRDIQALFESQQMFYQYPFKIVYCTLRSNTSSLRILISVPKRAFKKAVDRNRIKRLIREAWRRNQSQLLEIVSQKGIGLDIGLIYTAKIIHNYKEIEDKIILITKRLIKVNEDC